MSSLGFQKIQAYRNYYSLTKDAFFQTEFYKIDQPVSTSFDDHFNLLNHSMN